MKCDSGITRCEMLYIARLDDLWVGKWFHVLVENKAYGNPAWNEITLVDNQHDLFMSFFFFDIVQYRFTQGTQWISGVNNMQNNIRGVDDFIEFSIYSTRCALGIDGFNVISMCFWLSRG